VTYTPLSVKITYSLNNLNSLTFPCIRVKLNKTPPLKHNSRTFNIFNSSKDKPSTHNKLYLGLFSNNSKLRNNLLKFKNNHNSNNNPYAFIKTSRNNNNIWMLVILDKTNRLNLCNICRLVSNSKVRSQDSSTFNPIKMVRFIRNKTCKMWKSSNSKIFNPRYSSKYNRKSLLKRNKRWNNYITTLLFRSQIVISDELRELILLRV